MEKKMNVTLKPDAEKLVREKIERGEFKDASDLVDEAEAEFEALVREGIESGPATEMTHDTFEAIRREVRAKYGRKE
jgi:Arc/MetJ-type ribon-helix-helix transcriptional regulator